MWSIILKLLAPLLGALLAIVSVQSEKKTKSRRYFLTMGGLIIVSWIATSAILITDHFSIQDADQKRDEQTTMLYGIRAAQGDDKMFENYIAAYRVLIDNLSSQSSQTYIDELRKTLPKKRNKEKRSTRP